MTKQVKCESCGSNTVHVDGYAFGDRVLDGVMFVVKDIDGKPVCQGVVPGAEAYFSKLNKKRYKKECEEYCVQLDLANCAACGEDVEVWGTDA